MAKRKHTHAIFVELPQELHKAVHDYAKKHDLSVAQVIRKLIRQLLDAGK